jgi:hypothetical protein
MTDYLQNNIYSEYLMTRLYKIKQGSKTIRLYCLELEYLTNQLLLTRQITNITQFLFYSFMAGLEPKLLLLLKFLNVMDNNSAKNICLVVEANT